MIILVQTFSGACGPRILRRRTLQSEKNMATPSLSDAGYRIDNRSLLFLLLLETGIHMN